MGHWFYRNIVEPGKLPMLLALASFMLTFLVTRTVTRLIRAGRGPFKNITPGGMHIHHVVPGVILVVIGGFGAVGNGRDGPAAVVFAILFGIGAGLVLDEFALILHLDDVYWTEQGRQSVEVVVIASALALLALGGFSPLGVDQLTPDERQDRASLILTLAFNFLFVIIALFKGKLRMALIGTLIRSWRSSVRYGWPGPARPGPAASTATGPRRAPGPGCAPSTTTAAGTGRAANFRT